MKLIDHLGTFSIDDLRELARRRRILLHQEALRGRQTLVQTLAGALGRYEVAHAAVNSLNQAELGVLQFLLIEARHASLSRLCAFTGADPAVAKQVLEELRRWGLVFPEGDWEHIAIPGSTQLISGYLNPPTYGYGATPTPPMENPGAIRFTAPPLVKAPGISTAARTAGFSWDVAEFLARVARARLKLTQAGRMNKRDLRGMDTAFAVTTPGYSSFLYVLTANLGLLVASTAGTLVVPEQADAWLGQGEEARATNTLHLWEVLQGYPESTNGDPADTEYVPMLISAQRTAFLAAVREIQAGETVTVASLADRFAWSVPRSFKQWDGSQDPREVAARMTRSLYWLGLLTVDDPGIPAHASLTPLGGRLLRADASGPNLVPEEPQFFLQPNAEIFAPPNLWPRALFHLRRITGEKKGGAAGMYSLTADSLRRGLDSGLSVPEILTFLERFSRTGLASNVRALVETTGRQHGRIRLVPAGYVLVTDDTSLMEEIRSLKTIQPLMGHVLTDRVAEVDATEVPELLKRLRARGYAPTDLAESGDVPVLPEDPAVVAKVPELVFNHRKRVEGDLDWSRLDSPAEPRPGIEPTQKVTSRTQIVDMLQLAESQSFEVEIEYQGAGHEEPTVRTIQPWFVGPRFVEAFCCMRGDERNFRIDRISWARLTGESFLL